MTGPSKHPAEGNRPRRVRDPRSDKQKRKDVVGVERQLKGFRERDRHRKPLLDAVTRRRTGDSRRLQFEVAKIAEESLVVRGEILVRSDHAEAVGEALKGTGFENDGSVECLKDRVTRFVNRGADVDALTEAWKKARKADRRASLNPLTPLGPIAKGMFGPELSSVSSSYQPPVGDGESVVPVAVIDTGITAELRSDGWLTRVPRASDNIDPLNALGRDPFLDFGAGHGTFASGVIQQVAGDVADIMMYRAIDSDGVGSDVDVACALITAVKDGARIVNLSLGSETPDNEPPLALEVALQIIDKSDSDAVIVAAAGNSGGERKCWPAAFSDTFERVVAVAGLDASHEGAAWSTRGDWVTFSTVGEGILSTYVEGEESTEIDPEPDHFPASSWAVWTGTSFACPQVVGEIALRLAASPGQLPSDVVTALENSSPKVAKWGTKLDILEGTKLDIPEDPSS